MAAVAAAVRATSHRRGVTSPFRSLWGHMRYVGCCNTAAGGFEVLLVGGRHRIARSTLCYMPLPRPPSVQQLLDQHPPLHLSVLVSPPCFVGFFFWGGGVIKQRHLGVTPAYLDVQCVIKQLQLSPGTCRLSSHLSHWHCPTAMPMRQWRTPISPLRIPVSDWCDLLCIEVCGACLTVTEIYRIGVELRWLWLNATCQGWYCCSNQW